MTTPPHNPNLIVSTDGFENKSWTNQDRADSAKEALEQYRQLREFDPDIKMLSIDLITDILHFLHSKEIDPDIALDNSRIHFQNEVTL